MTGKLRKDLEEVYRRYGFELAKTYDDDRVLVFTLKTGYFDNADIVPLSVDYNTSKAFQDFSSAGYACTVRNFLTAKQTEQDLFKGFFSANLIVERLKNAYKNFAESIVRSFADDAKYEYINAPYTVNGTLGDRSPADEVIARLKEDRPVLFLIEAAAGFGKTCTAYEIVNRLVDGHDYLPLFSELYRNRKAPIFRYVLLDEIDRKFPGLNSRLVQAEIVNGRIVTILDGFDELLRKGDDVDDFENQEPMLETIGQFLKGHAKIVLTTRRTVLFEGDAFHAWASDHADEFELVRIRIGEPSLVHWLQDDRLRAIQATSLDLKNSLANPVLLSYLRCIPQNKFDAVIQEPQELVEKYFDFLLERERTRQDLPMTVETQKSILTTIAGDMIAAGYTSEQRDFIVDLILNSCISEIEDALALYPSSERPDREFLANKIASHALLDRSSKEESKIGFINEFVLGYFVSRNIFSSKEWLNDDVRFLEPAVASYRPRPKEERQVLLEYIRDSLEFVSVSYRADFTARLIGEIDFDLLADEAGGLDFDGVVFGLNRIDSFQFNECVFRNCSFVLDKMSDVTFLDCKFYENNVASGSPSGAIYILGEIGDANFMKRASSNCSVGLDVHQPDHQALVDRHVLEKFWPVGREKLMHKHRPVSGICSGHGDFRPDEIYDSIYKLKKSGILLEPKNPAFVELNFERLPEIRYILGRVA